MMSIKFVSRIGTYNVRNKRLTPMYLPNLNFSVKRYTQTNNLNAKLPEGFAKRSELHSANSIVFHTKFTPDKNEHRPESRMADYERARRAIVGGFEPYLH